MEIWIVVLPLSSGLLSDEDYHQCLQQVDIPSQARVKRFYHRQDSWRECVDYGFDLITTSFPFEEGCLIVFGRTEAGKPFIVSPILSPAVGYNITHDNDVVAMVSRQGDRQSVDKIGIDVMKRALPKGETVSSFLQAIESTLTPSELAMFTPELDPTDAVRHIFLLWTLKEAYTKALGLGLGFDFKRINYNIDNNSVSVDGRETIGWDFLLFEVWEHGQPGVYQGAVANWTGDDQTRMEFISNVDDDPRVHFKDWSQLIDPKI